MAERVESQPTPEETGIVPLGDAAVLIRGGEGSGRDDKRYDHNS